MGGTIIPDHETTCLKQGTMYCRMIGEGVKHTVAELVELARTTAELRRSNHRLHDENTELRAEVDRLRRGDWGAK